MHEARLRGVLRLAVAAGSFCVLGVLVGPGCNGGSAGKESTSTLSSGFCADTCPRACGSDEDCDLSIGQVCGDYGDDGNACVPAAEAPRLCSTDSQCDSSGGEACLRTVITTTQRQCAAPSKGLVSCSRDSQCDTDSGQKCCKIYDTPICLAASRCPASCHDESACNTKAGEVCCTSLPSIDPALGVDGLCIDPSKEPCPRTCYASSDCNTETGDVCCNGICSSSCDKPCQTSDDCPGQVCCKTRAARSPFRIRPKVGYKASSAGVSATGGEGGASGGGFAGIPKDTDKAGSTARATGGKSSGGGSDETGGNGGGGGTSGTSPTGGSSATAGDTGAAGSPTTGGASASGGSDNTGGTGSAGGCVDVSIDVTPARAVMVLVIDKSTSMNESAPSTGVRSKWEAARDALVAAIPNLPSTLAVGELFYPNVSVPDKQPQGCQDANSLTVAPAPLSDAEQVSRLVAGVQSVPNPTTPPGTPTYDAYAIGIQLVQAFLASPPAGFESAMAYVVLTTDGMPTHTSNCGDAFGMNNSPRLAISNAEWQEIIDLAETAAAQGIRTHVVGLPGSENRNQVPCAVNGQPTLENACDETDPTQIDYLPMGKLSELAVAGQTAPAGCSLEGPSYCHIDLTAADDYVADFQAVLAQIAGSGTGCEYALPSVAQVQDAAGTNVIVDYAGFTLEYYANGATSAAVLDASTDACATGDFQYNAGNTSFTLCEATCATVQSDASAILKANLGCLDVP